MSISFATLVSFEEEDIIPEIPQLPSDTIVKYTLGDATKLINLPDEILKIICEYAVDSKERDMIYKIYMKNMSLPNVEKYFLATRNFYKCGETYNPNEIYNIPITHEIVKHLVDLQTVLDFAYEPAKTFINCHEKHCLEMMLKGIFFTSYHGTVQNVHITQENAYVARNDVALIFVLNDYPYVFEFKEKSSFDRDIFRFKAKQIKFHSKQALMRRQHDLGLKPSFFKVGKEYLNKKELFKHFDVYFKLQDKVSRKRNQKLLEDVYINEMYNEWKLLPAMHTQWNW